MSKCAHAMLYMHACSQGLGPHSILVMLDCMSAFYSIDALYILLILSLGVRPNPVHTLRLNIQNHEENRKHACAL